MALLALLMLVLPSRVVVAQSSVADAELEARIAEVRAERDQVRLAGPIVAVAIGALVLQGGLSTIVSAQYNCPGYWDCSDEVRWGITGGAGGAIVVGAITLGLSAPVLSKRLRARRAFNDQINQMRAGQSEVRRDRSFPLPLLGFDLTGERKDFRLVFLY